MRRNRSAVSAHKREPAKQQVQRPPSAEEIAQQEGKAPTTAKLTIYLGAATVHIEVASQ